MPKFGFLRAHFSLASTWPECLSSVNKQRKNASRLRHCEKWHVTRNIESADCNRRRRTNNKKRRNVFKMLGLTVAARKNASFFQPLTQSCEKSTKLSSLHSPSSGRSFWKRENMSYVSLVPVRELIKASVHTDPNLSREHSSSLNKA